MTTMTSAHQEAWVPRQTFGIRLILIRRELGFTVKQAAERCGIHYATWSTWENGAKPADLVRAVTDIANALGVDRDWLMWGQTQNAPRPDGPEGEGESLVRHEGLEPPTRWFEGSRPAADLIGVAA